MKLTVMSRVSLFLINCLVPVFTQGIQAVSESFDEGIFIAVNPVPEVLTHAGTDAEIIRHRFSGIKSEELFKWRHRIALVAKDFGDRCGICDHRIDLICTSFGCDLFKRGTKRLSCLMVTSPAISFKYFFSRLGLQCT